MTEKRLLVVDDEILVARDIQKSLQELGYHVPDFATSAEQAIEMANEFTPDLVLMDIKLKGEMDGIATARIIKGMDIPVIFITAYSDKDTLGRAKQVEPLGYINKPFNIKDLHTTVEMALYKHQEESKLKMKLGKLEWSHDTLKSVGDSLIATDNVGTIIFMNKVAEELTGLNRDEVLGNHINDAINLTCGEITSGFEDIIEEVLKEGKTFTLPFGSYIQTRDEKSIPVSDSISPIINKDGNIIGLVFIIFDERKPEPDLKSINPEEGMVTGNSENDLNNILAGILDYTRLSIMRPIKGNEDKLMNNLMEIQCSAERAQDLIGRILTSDVNDEYKKSLVMIVDDNQMVAESLGEILESYGFDVIVFMNSKDALKRFRQLPDEIDLVITDQIMPEMNGLELAEELSSLRPDIPIIINTAFSEELDKEIAKKAGIKAYFTKPVDFDALLDKINELI